MADTKISLLTAVATPAAGDEFPVNQGSVSKKMTLQQISDFAAQDGSIEAFMLLDSAYVLTSTTAAQKLFNGSANGALTLVTGWYRFDCQFVLTSMSATSGNAQFQLLGAGTATLGGVIYQAIGSDGNSGTAATRTGSYSTTSNSAASMLTAGTGTAMQADVTGVFEVTSGGTIIPSVALVTAAAAVVAVGSYFRCRRWGAAGANVVQGSWS